MIFLCTTKKHDLVEVSWGGRAVVAELRRTARRVLRVEVRPPGQLVVFAPLDAEKAELIQRLSKKGAWIFRELDRMDATPASTPERRYVSGETHLFLGNQYRLSLEQGADPFVRLSGTRMVATLRNVDDHAQCRRLLSAFYALSARAIFRERLDIVVAPFERKGLKRPFWSSERWQSDGAAILRRGASY